MLRNLGVAIFIGSVVFGYQANARSLYSVIEIGKGVDRSYSYDINNYGQVTGYIGVGYGKQGARSFVWDTSGMEDLGTLGAFDAYAYAINDLGQVAGELRDNAFNSSSFIYDPVNELLDIGLLGEECCSQIKDINNLGLVAGQRKLLGGAADYEAFIWDASGGLVDIGTLRTVVTEGFDYSYSQAINDLGQVVGTSTSDNGIRAFLYDGINGMVDIGTLPPPDGEAGLSYAKAINNSSQVAGFAVSVDGYLHAFIYDDANDMVDLGTLGGGRSQAYGINDDGHVVGYSEIDTGGDHAFIYDDVNGMVDINTLLHKPPGGIVLRYAHAINNSGQIIASGEKDGITSSYLLTPLPEYFAGIDVGEVAVNHRPARVNFSHRFSNPVVIAHMVTKVESHPCVLRIFNVDQVGFTIQVQEYEYLDRIHGKETVSYMVMEEGVISLPDGAVIEAGSFVASSAKPHFHGFQSANFSTPPVVMASITSKNGSQAVTGRVKKINTTGLVYMQQEQEANRDGHVAETVSYIAWEPGSGKVDTIRYEVGKVVDFVDHHPEALAYGQYYKHPPIVFADMQSTKGTNTATLAVKETSTTGLSVFVEEESSRDEETAHVKEDVGYIALIME